MAAHVTITAVLCLWLALHSFTTYPLSLLVLSWFGVGRPSMGRGNAEKKTHTFAICTCAYNEQAVIEAKLHNLLALRALNPGLEILVYVDAAADETAAICRRYEDQIILHVAEQRHGKTHGMNLLVSQAQSEIVVFTDANVILALDVIDRLQDHFQDDDVGCVCGNLTYVNPQDSVTANSGSLYWRIEEGIKRLESITGSVIGADGSLFALRRSLHVPPPDHIIDDFFLSLMVLCQRKRVIQALDVKAYEESISVSAEENRRKVRIACQAFNVHRLLWRAQLARLDPLSLYKYVSHKLLRWFSILFFALAWALCVLAAAMGGSSHLAWGVVCGPVALWVFGAKWPLKPFSQIYDIFSAFGATGIGVLRSLRGDRFQTWVPAASLRTANFTSATKK